MKRQHKAAKGRKVKADPAAKAMLAARKDHRHPDRKKAAKKKACRGGGWTAEAIGKIVADHKKKCDALVLTPSQQLGWILSDSVHGYCVEKDDDLGVFEDDVDARMAARGLGFILRDGEVVSWKCPECGNDWLQHVEEVSAVRAIHFGEDDIDAARQGGGAKAGAPTIDWESADADDSVLECRRCMFRFAVPPGLITEWE